MGLLDDAIREHLELKRRHGAPEGEVTRLETEVFGQTPAPAPAREEPSGVDPPEPADPAAPESVPLEPAAAEPAAPPAFEPAAAEPAAPPAFEPAPPLAPGPAPAGDPQPVAEDPEPPHGDVLDEAVPESPAYRDDEPWLDDPDEVPADERLDHPRRQPTTEFTPDDHASARGETGHVAPDDEPAEDVLEETPEFLQETPEHDRLWFEQRPPRDFDFGG